MSLFIMGFQFMPSGLALTKDKQALTQYTENLSQNADTKAAPQADLSRKSGTTIDLPWINVKVSIPNVDFGLDTLYGLDQETRNSTLSDELKF